MRSHPGGAAPRRHPVAVHAADPVALAGVVALLQTDPGLDVVSTPAEADVVVVVADVVASALLDDLRSIAADCAVPVVLVLDDDFPLDLFRAVEYGVAAVVPRHQVTAERLAEAILAVARGGAHFPAGRQAQLLAQIRHVQRAVLGPNDLHAHGLTTWELEVLRLVAAGRPLHEVGVTLGCSDRTVKKVLHGAAVRLGMRSRIEVVVYASRVGAI